MATTISTIQASSLSKVSSLSSCRTAPRSSRLHFLARLAFPKENATAGQHDQSYQRRQRWTLEKMRRMLTGSWQETSPHSSTLCFDGRDLWSTSRTAFAAIAVERKTWRRKLSCERSAGLKA